MTNLTHLQRALLIVALCFTGAYLIPVHQFPYRSFFSELCCIAGILISLVYLLFRRGATLRLTSALVLPLGLIILLAIQAGSGLLVYPADIFFPILILSGFAASIVLGASMAKFDNGLPEISHTLAYTFIVSCLLSLICQHVQLFNWDWSPWVRPLTAAGLHRPAANIGQPNLLALLYCFSLISVWYLYSIQKIKPIVALGLAVLVLWGSALTQSRTAWLIFCLFVILCWRPPVDTKYVPKKILLGLCVIFVLMVFVAPIFSAWLGWSVDSIAHRAGQNSIRLILWSQAWKFSWLHPWFGAGWYQFGAEQVKYAEFFPAVEYADHAHNIVLNFADEIGWPFTLTIFGAAAYWFYCRCIRRWENIQVRFLGLLIVAVMTHSLIEYPLWFAIFSIPLALIVGALENGQLDFKDYILPRPVVGALALLTVVGIVFICKDVNQITNAFSASDNGQANSANTYSRPFITTVPQFYDYLFIRELNINPQNARANIALFEQQSLRFGYAPVLESLAFLYAWDSRPKLAAVMLTKIQRLHDENTDSYSRIYQDWRAMAAEDNRYFGEIFKQLPPPMNTPITPKLLEK